MIRTLKPREAKRINMDRVRFSGQFPKRFGERYRTRPVLSCFGRGEATRRQPADGVAGGKPFWRQVVQVLTHLGSSGQIETDGVQSL
ncbi:MAG: hypothetical protein ACK5Q5_14120 [Planctomycetaceae bacterium]